jgi:hypothetical protein
MVAKFGNCGLAVIKREPFSPERFARVVGFDEATGKYAVREANIRNHLTLTLAPEELGAYTRSKKKLPW